MGSNYSLMSALKHTGTSIKENWQINYTMHKSAC